MCMACELGFWMAMEEEPPAKPARKAARAEDAFQCDAPAEKPKARRAKPRRRVKTSSVSAARE